MDILIVDDIPMNRRLLRAVLETEGHEIREAADGVEALETLDRQPADAVISDILMPRMDGYRLCYEIRSQERFRHLPFMFYTSSYTSTGDEKLALEMGADRFLVKPAPAPEILRVLTETTSVTRRQPLPAEPSRDLSLMKEYNQQLVAKLEEKNTELTTRNAELNAMQVQLQRLLDHSPAVLYQLKIDGGLVTPLMVSDNIERQLGVTRDKCRSHEWWFDNLHPEDRERVLASIEQALQEGGGAMEYRLRHQDQSYRWVADNCRVITDEAGRPTEMIGVWTDITERKLAQEKIAEQAAFLDKARDAIIVRDLKGHILFWNEGAERIYGWTHDEVIGLKIAGLLFIDAGKFHHFNHLAIRQGEWSGELPHQTKDGREIIVESRWTLVRDEDGQPKSLLEINTDITEKKKIEAQFMRAQRMESIGTLAGGIAHDLNNILSPILMSIDILKARAADARTLGTLETIEISARRGAGIVRQVLSFARGLEGERVEIQPKHLLRDVENLLHETFPKNIRLQFFIPDDTWTIQGDATQMHQILLNLCVNARDAMPEGGALTVRAENRELDAQDEAMNPQARAGRYVTISVTDTGTGIAPATLDKVFEPFFTTKAPDKGTGLGLSTVLAIVKSHAGFIHVTSEPGRGASFLVYLPALDFTDRLPDEARPEETLPRGHGETVLVVDDEASILTITGQTLQAYGYHVLTSINGAEALAIYAQRQEEIHVVLTDMMMPILDGPAMILALLRINPQARIIAASGLEANNNTAKVAAAGVTHFLNKPYTAGTLLNKIREILDLPAPGPAAARAAP
jgi:PAS domain S-box-containing protein